MKTLSASKSRTGKPIFMDVPSWFLQCYYRAWHNLYSMFVVNSLPVAILFCIITMLGWGSWANTQKLAGKEKWPFQLFYWDYAIGVFLFSLLFAATFGSL